MNVSLRLIPEQKRPAVLKKWFELVLETYPANAAMFLKQEKDSLLNPVGSTISQEITTLYDELIHEMNEERLRVALDKIIRIRAIQEFLPSQAVSFILLLKKVVREELISELKESDNLKELIEFESRIDKVTLLAFDIYIACREKVFEIRVNELAVQRESALNMLDMANQEYK